MMVQVLLFKTAGSFGIDDGDGGEYVRFKMNKRFFQQCRVHSSSLKMSNVGKFPWTWFRGDRTQV